MVFIVTGRFYILVLRELENMENSVDSQEKATPDIKPAGVVLDEEKSEKQQQEIPVEKERVGNSVDSEEDNERADTPENAKSIGGKPANKKPTAQRKNPLNPKLNNRPTNIQWPMRLVPLVPVSHNAYYTSQSSLSSTNLYIRGLPQNTTDSDLVKLCEKYGKITSTKAILDKQTNVCKGYGFVDFESAADAQMAVSTLQSLGILAQFAKQQEQDPTNLYISNLPKEYQETDIESILSQFGPVISTRVLRDAHGVSKGVGFARLENRDACEKAITVLHGKIIHGSPDPLMVKFADCGTNKKKLKSTKWKYPQEYIYDPSSVFMSQPVMTSGRNLVQQLPTQPYVAAPVMPTYPNVQSGPWQAPYIIPPSSPLGGNTIVDNMHGPQPAVPQLTAQMGHLAISSTSGYTGTHGGTQYVVTAPQQNNQYGPWSMGGTHIHQQDNAGLDDRNMTQVSYYHTGYVSMDSAR